MRVAQRESSALLRRRSRVQSSLRIPTTDALGSEVSVPYLISDSPERRATCSVRLIGEVSRFSICKQEFKSPTEYQRGLRANGRHPQCVSRLSGNAGEMCGYTVILKPSKCGCRITVSTTAFQAVSEGSTPSIRSNTTRTGTYYGMQFICMCASVWRRKS